jgi:adhesin HecA-like repeat protein
VKFFIRQKSGLTLIEVVVGTGLMLTVFLGIFGLIQLSFKVVAQSKARITATALANQKIELTRNLTYNDVGTIGGIPAGSIPETATTTLNGVVYNIKTTVTYIDDPFDGTSPADSAPWDYKRFKVLVTWEGFLGGSVFLVSDISPKGLETVGSGGIISILVFDASGQPLPQADVHVENTFVTPAIDAFYQTDDQGRLFLPGAPVCDICYKITASKTDHSSERTYAIGELIRGTAIAVPAKPLLSVLEGQQSEISFSIDRLRTKTVQTTKYVEEKTWNDSFEDLTKISGFFQTIASTTLNAITLDQSSGQYYQTGSLISTAITPTGLTEWGRMNWNQNLPALTEIKLHLLYATSSSWQLIPDADLTVDGITNSAGFISAPIDLSGLDPLKYSVLKLQADFRSDDPTQTPSLFDWQISWFSSETSTPIPYLAFSMQGAKSLGLDSASNPIAKYQQNLETDATGQVTIDELEWDSYKITVNGTVTGYDIANSAPYQPVNLNPDTDQTVVLKLAPHQTNTLLVTVKNPAGLPLESAGVRLFKTGYDKLKFASNSGQAFFSSLSSADYTIEVKMSGYEALSTSLNISGQTDQSVSMLPL